MAISTQVLAEVSATLLHKVSPAVTPETLVDLLAALAPIRLIAINGDTVRRAVEVRAKYRVHFYDCMILATAERGALPNTAILCEFYSVIANPRRVANASSSAEAFNIIFGSAGAPRIAGIADRSECKRRMDEFRKPLLLRLFGYHPADHNSTGRLSLYTGTAGAARAW